MLRIGLVVNWTSDINPENSATWGVVRNLIGRHGSCLISERLPELQSIHYLYRVNAPQARSSG